MNTELLPKVWQNFIKKMQEFPIVPEAQWKAHHALGYFCHRYEQHYQIPFALSLIGAPSKCQEIVMLKKAGANLNAATFIPVKAYLDWFFDVRLKKDNTKFKSISILIAKGIMNEYLLFKKQSSKITKSTEIPEDYKQIVNSFEISASTYGDLALILKALEEDSESDSRKHYKAMMDQLHSLGLEDKLLEAI